MVADDLRQSDEYKELQRIKETPTPEIQHVEDRAAIPEPTPETPEADLSGASGNEETRVEAHESPVEQPKDEDSTTILKDIRNLLQSLLEAFKGIFKKD
jgi:hypothetical protein